MSVSCIFWWVFNAPNVSVVTEMKTSLAKNRVEVKLLSCCVCALAGRFTFPGFILASESFINVVIDV